MHHLLDEEVARSHHVERTRNLELEHRQKLAGSLGPVPHQQR